MQNCGQRVVVRESADAPTGVDSDLGCDVKRSLQGLCRTRLPVLALSLGVSRVIGQAVTSVAEAGALAAVNSPPVAVPDTASGNEDGPGITGF